MSEDLRLKALYRYRVLDTLPEQAFDDITHLAAKICDVPLAFMTLVDESRAWFKSTYGTTATGSDRCISFCDLTIHEQQILIITDATLDPRFAQNPFVKNEPQIRFYAGVPLISPTGQAIGTLCVVGYQPKKLSLEQIDALGRLGRMIIHLLETRLKAQHQKDTSQIVTLLNTVASAANESSNVRECILRCIKEICAFTGSPVGHYLELDPKDADQLVSSGLWFLSDVKKFQRFQDATNDIRFFRGSGIPGLTWEAGAPVWSADTYNLESFFRCEACREADLTSVFSFPVLHKSEVVGVFEFFLQNDFEPDDDLLRIMNHVGTQIARVIERARAEEALEKQREFLNAVLENLADGIVACNAEGELTLFNQATREFHGLDTNTEVAPENWPNYYTLFHGDGRTLFKYDEIPLVRALHGEHLKDVEMVIAPVNGEPRSLLASGRSIWGKDGKKMGAVVAMHDITQMKAAKADLLETNRALRAATEAKSEFLANMSHEIRTPLNGVIGMTDLLLDSELRPGQRESLEVVQSSANSLLTIISDILDFSKIEAGKLDLEQVQFDLQEVVGEVYRTLEFSAKQKDLKLTHSTSGEMKTQFIGDPSRIRQILMNLVMNAIKFTDVGEIRTSVSLTPRSGGRTAIRIEVRDSGAGIPAHVLKRLFQAFSQADSSTTRRFGGTGLGLSISKRLVNLMKGDIGVESEVGQGSTFWFHLELENALTPRFQKNRHDDFRDVSASPTSTTRILLAEDNLVNQMITMKMLEKMGFKADLVVDGKAVLTALQQTHYDLVLMDCQMPEMDGYEASGLIRTSGPVEARQVAIIAMTANAMKGDREKCLAAGMNDYVSKPVKIEELQSAILRNLKKPLSA